MTIARPSTALVLAFFFPVPGCSVPSLDDGLGPCGGGTCSLDSSSGTGNEGDGGTTEHSGPSPSGASSGTEPGTTGSGGERPGSDGADGSTETIGTPPPLCGDGVVDPAEACDDGLDNGSYGHCNRDCSGLGPHCGDGEIQADETCDDRNGTSNDGCDADCRPTQVVELEAGSDHNCVVFRSGDVKCWGAGADGRLGYGGVENIGDDERPSDVGVLDLGGAVATLALGRSHSCALLREGQVKCWGGRHASEAGYGPGVDVGPDAALGDRGFVEVDREGRTVVQLAAGAAHTCALFDDGAVRCWGQPDFGPLGQGAFEPIGDDEVPADVDVIPLGVDVERLAAAPATSHVCVRLSSGRVRCWGYNGNGELGNGTMRIAGDESSIGVGDEPGEVEAIADVRIAGGGILFATHVAAGLGASCAATAAEVRCWGAGLVGAGPTGSEVTQPPATSLPALASAGTITRIAMGGYHACVVDDRGDTRCWGRNDAGQLGDGSRDAAGDDLRPGAVLLALEEGTRVVDLALGRSHTCALLSSTGGVRCWGHNAEGQLGYGNAAEMPELVDRPENIADVALFESRQEADRRTDHTSFPVGPRGVRPVGG